MEGDQKITLISNQSDLKSNRRKADELGENPYEDINQQLRELYQQRQRNKEIREPDQNKKNDEPIHVILDDSPPRKVEIKPEPKAEDEEKKIEIKEPVEEKPIFWLNRLRYYPSDYLPEHMVSFREMMYEDLLKKDNVNPKRTLQFLFMTTFGHDMELLGPIVKSGVKFVLADEWDKPTEPRIERNFHGYSNMTLIRSPKDPSRNYTGAFHPKIWLLRFPKFLRVVVGSGNLTAGDWIIWSNCLWFKDLPKKSEMGTVPPKKKLNPGEFDFDKEFEDNLKSFLNSLMPNKAKYTDILDVNIDDYHISDIDIVLIPSIPGRHKDENFDKYGHRKVGAIISKLFPAVAPPTKKKYVLSYQTTSVGGLDEKFMKEVCSSFLPGYMTINDLKSEKKSNKGISFSSIDSATKRVKLIFPPKDYVENCLEGPEYSNCLILAPETYQKESFPKDIFYQFQAPEHYAFHEGIIPHLKVWVVTEESGEINDDSIIYFGSHNFSPSAWGRYEKDYTQLSIANSELGVLMPPMKGSKARKQKVIDSLSFKFPPQKYEKNQKPWIFRLHFST